jgi:hypothetical protein
VKLLCSKLSSNCQEYPCNAGAVAVAAWLVHLLSGELLLSLLLLLLTLLLLSL